MPDYEGLYACPLCLKLFDVEAVHSGELTRDHTPPESLGGKLEVLTCKTCNNESGHRLEDEMLAEERFFEVLGADMGKRMTMKITTWGETLNADVQIAGNSILIFGDPKRNHPDAHKRVMDRVGEAFENGPATSKFDFTLNFREPNRRMASVGWLKSAYLLMFAAFGYNYIFSSELEPVRSQLMDIQSEVLPILGLVSPEKLDRKIVLVDEPATCRSIFVMMGSRHGIFLPRDGDQHLYERLRQDSALQNGTLGHFSGRGEIPWPTRTAFLFDREQIPV